MSEVKEWLSAMGIAGIERLGGVFEAQGFSSWKSRQYLDEADLDYMFSTPKKLQLAEKHAQELQHLKLKFSDKEINLETLPISAPTVTPPTAVNSPLEHCKMELVENGTGSFLEAQVSSAQEYLSQLRRENDWLQTVTHSQVVEIVIRAVTTEIKLVHQHQSFLKQGCFIQTDSIPTIDSGTWSKCM